MTFDEAEKAKQELPFTFYSYLGITFHIFVMPSEYKDFEAMANAVKNGKEAGNELAKEFCTNDKYRLGALGWKDHQLFHDRVSINGHREV